MSPADPASRVQPKSDHSPRQPPLIQASVTSHHLDSTFSIHSFYKVHGLSGLSELLLFMSPNSKKKIQICTPQYILFSYLNDVHVSLQQCMKYIASHVLKTEFKGCDEDSKGLKIYILLAVQKNILLSVKNTYILKSTSLRHSLHTIKHLFCIQFDTMASRQSRYRTPITPQKFPHSLKCQQPLMCFLSTLVRFIISGVSHKWGPWVGTLMRLTSSTQCGVLGAICAHLLGSSVSLCGCITICLRIHLFMDF